MTQERQLRLDAVVSNIPPDKQEVGNPGDGQLNKCGNVEMHHVKIVGTRSHLSNNLRLKDTSTIMRNLPSIIC